MGVTVCALFLIGAYVCNARKLHGSMDGLVFEYDRWRQTLTVEVEGGEGSMPIAIPNQIYRMAYVDQNGTRLNIGGNRFGDTEKPIYGWFIGDVVALRPGIRVVFDLPVRTRGDLHIVVRDEYIDAMKKMAANEGTHLWTGDVVLR